MEVANVLASSAKVEAKEFGDKKENELCELAGGTADAAMFWLRWRVAE